MSMIELLSAVAKDLGPKAKSLPQVQAQLAALRDAETRKTDYAARGRLAWETIKAKRAAAATAAAQPAKPAQPEPKAKRGRARKAA